MARPTRDRGPERTGKVLGWVSVAALVALVAVAIGGILLAQDLAERQAVHDAVDTSQLLAQSVITPNLENDLINGRPGRRATVKRWTRWSTTSSATRPGSCG